MFWVYILKCADESYYTGHTDDLEHRFAQHQDRTFPKCYTATRLPVKLVFSEEFATRDDAFDAENKFKVGVVRKKKR